MTAGARYGPDAKGPMRPDPEGPSPRTGSVVSRWLERTASPVPLGLFRIVVFGMLSLGTLGIVPAAPSLADILRYAALPPELVVAPMGLGWVPTWALDQSLVAAGGVALILTAGAAALGWRIRWSGWVSVVLAMWVLAVPQFFGKVNHYHHLVWFAALLAASPCTDALTPWTRAAPPPAPSPGYGFPLRVGWLVLGFLYLGAGIAKARTGLSWALSDTLRNHTWAMAFERGLDLPSLPDPVWQALAVSGLVFELGFIIAILHPRSRRWAVVAGLVFHISTYVTLGIAFTSLMACYVIFASWPTRPERPARDEEPRLGSVATGMTVLALVAATGIAGMVNGWPFASYPSFAGIRGTTSNRLAITLPDGDVFIPLASTVDWMSASRVDGITRGVLRDPTPEKLEALGSVIRESSPWLADVDELDVWHLRYSVTPDTRGEMVQPPTRLGEIPVR